MWLETLPPGVEAGTGLRADADVLLGYPPDRPERGPLRMGADCRVRSGSVLYLGTSIGARLQTGHHVVVREGCRIGDDVSVWSGTVVDYGCSIGSRVKIHTGCYVAQFTEIGDDAFLAPAVAIANDLYPGDAASREVMSGPRIGAGAQIGVNVTILPFVHIGDGALIGAGSTVTRDVPAGCVAYGNPAVVHGSVDSLVDVKARVRPVDGSASRYGLAREAR
jgi:acetyltransferase-like isoleucine patch superfamily enzyme